MPTTKPRPAAAAILGILLVGSLVISVAAPAVAKGKTISVNCPTQNLQTKIDNAPVGATMLIKGTCIGNFTVNKDLMLLGNPKATLDANGSGQTLVLQGSEDWYISDLKITGADALTSGGGIVQQGGTLTVANSTVSGNQVGGLFVGGAGIFHSGGTLRILNSRIKDNVTHADAAAGASALGGGIYSVGTLSVINSTMTGNVAWGTSSNNTATASGGAIFSSTTGKVTISNSSIAENQSAAQGDTGSTAHGAGIYLYSNKPFEVQRTTISGNLVDAVGADAAEAAGGGIFIGAVGKLTVGRSTISGNQVHAQAPNDLSVASGGGIMLESGPMVFSRSKLLNNTVLAEGSLAAQGVGGGAFSDGSMVFTRSRISGNQADSDSSTGVGTSRGGGIGGLDVIAVKRSTVSNNTMTPHADASAGQGFGAGVYSDGQLILSSSTVSGNSMSAVVPPSASGQLSGGGIYVDGLGGTLTNSTIANNSVQAGNNGAVGTAVAYGAGITASGTSVNLRNLTIAGNSVGATALTAVARGGGVSFGAGIFSVEGSIIADNTTTDDGPDCDKFLGGSDGYNLIGDDTNCAFASQPSDINNASPKLGALKNNGGSTQTMAIAKSSPARDEIPKSQCPARDQRGVKRPQGKRCDIGAYERS